MWYVTTNEERALEQQIKGHLDVCLKCDREHLVLCPVAVAMWVRYVAWPHLVLAVLLLCGSARAQWWDFNGATQQSFGSWADYYSWAQGNGVSPDGFYVPAASDYGDIWFHEGIELFSSPNGWTWSAAIPDSAAVNPLPGQYWSPTPEEAWSKGQDASGLFPGIPLSGAVAVSGGGGMTNTLAGVNGNLFGAVASNVDGWVWVAILVVLGLAALGVTRKATPRRRRI